MYEIIKSVINEGRYELSDILTKIDTIWIQGDITEEQKTELVLLAQEKAKPENSYAPLQKQVDTLFTNFAEIAKQVGINTLEIANTKAKMKEGGIVVPDPEPEPEEEYPAWKQPTNATDAYYRDDKMTYRDGFRYICTAPVGYAVTYGPDILPQMWKKVEKEKEEGEELSDTEGTDGTGETEPEPDETIS